MTDMTAPTQDNAGWDEQGQDQEEDDEGWEHEDDEEDEDNLAFVAATEALEAEADG